MKIVVDMNLTPAWVALFEDQGWSAVHWSKVGNPRATDREIMTWAVNNGYIVFTHDLDFGALLAATQANSPSVIQIRAQDVLPAHLGGLIVPVLRQYEDVLEAGALITVDETQSRVRILPIGR